MKIIIKKMILLNFLLIIVACNKHEKIQNDYYSISDSIKIEEPSILFPMVNYKNYFFCVNVQKTRFEVYSLKGKLLSYFGEKGKGPKELLKITNFDTYKNEIYLADRGNRKIVHISFNEKNKELEYINEFKCNADISDICVFNKNKIFITCWVEEKNVKLYNEEGKLLKEYSTNKENDRTTPIKLLETACLIDNIDNTILISNILNMDLKFYNFDDKNNELGLIKKTRVNYKRSSKKADISESRLDILGLGYTCISNNYFCISFNPQIKDLKKTFFEKYDKNGKYIGNSYLINQKKVFGPTFFSKDLNRLYFMDLIENDNTIFVCRKNQEEK